MIRAAHHTKPVPHSLGTRRQWRWALGLFTALLVSSPTWMRLPTAAGQAQLHRHLAAVSHNLSTLNVLQEVSQIEVTTHHVVGVNQRIVSLLQQMNQQENLNQVIQTQLSLTGHQLQTQVTDVTRLEQLTAQQEPLSHTIESTTTSLNQVMAGVAKDAMAQAQTMQGIVTLSGREGALLAQLNALNRTILDRDLAPSIQITNAMAGR